MNEIQWHSNLDFSHYDNVVEYCHPNVIQSVEHGIAQTSKTNPWSKRQMTGKKHLKGKEGGVGGGFEAQSSKNLIFLAIIFFYSQSNYVNDKK